MRRAIKWIKEKLSSTVTSSDENYTIEDIELPPALEKKINMLRPYIEKNSDMVARQFFIKGEENICAVAIYIEGLIDTESLNSNVLKPLMLDFSREQLDTRGSKYLIDHICQTSLTVGQINTVDTFFALRHSIFDGLTVLILDGIVEALVIDIPGGENRAIEEPNTEKSIRGPREGFIENLGINISLIRRKLRDPNLIIEKMLIGKRSRTDVAILYIEDIADPQIVSEVKERVSKIQIDGNVLTGTIEQHIEDNPYSIFPQIQATERPDKIVAHLLEGKVAILANGTPYALVLPSLFIQFMLASEDYFERTYVGSLVRMLRFIAFFLAVSLPSIYVSLLSFQQELIPFDLVVSLAENRKQVPLPVAVEAFIMEIIIQITMETGLRLPTPLGQTVGVVGGIILGQAAISANLGSPAVVIVISITTICTFAIPTYSMTLVTRLLRLILLALTSIFGIFGFSLGWLLILAHLTSLESVGVPYFAPFAPTRFDDLKDSFVRIFINRMKNRPVSIPVQDRKRQTNMGRKNNKDGK